MEIRAEQANDYSAIRQVNELAFGRSQEADLVEALRASGLPLISLVAIESLTTIDQDEESAPQNSAAIVGHLLFSPVTIEPLPAVPLKVAGLAPIAVLPTFQRRGIASQLIQVGVGQCCQQGYDAIVVLGNPQFYRRFGFAAASLKQLRCEYDVPEEAFMVMELQPNALVTCAGTVKYAPAFANV
ncbi:GNAT family N-acetyltransferase [Alkalinema pantanalense CENA528]|uniref:GNAT family N-acetyltransferase n=1 Tax=Alkalinema pantanalense TaxID=1620705 RepID=UPI003D6FAA40